MIVVGLTGGIATGKTTVAQLLRERGAAVVDTDEIAREVTAPGSPALSEIAQAFGPQMLTAQGTLDRKRLGSLVFDDPQARRRLEEITHPRIILEMRRRLEALRRRRRPPALAVAVIPLLYEAGAESEVDVVVAVTAPAEQQVRRVMARDGLTREQAQARVAAQMPVEEKARRAGFVVDASGSLEETARQVAKLWGRLVSAAGE
ncbi:MAG TPA: dephospho-CoA kinase [Armatimonadota bacterium]|nr:dephospho-CoA kinase [Armatimonadota bacterium]